MKKASLFVIMLLTILCITSCSTVEKDVNPDSIVLNSIEGLNEQIVLNLAKPTAGEYTISYKTVNAKEYAVLDRELILDNGETLDCYILGLAKGLYTVKVEIGEGDTYARKSITDIDVEKQDRSGYAHFKREEGVGGYNNDGTVKDGAVILYVNNENKNTITLDIDGTTYTGLVHVLQALEHTEKPVIIRVTDKITTNQWCSKKFEPRLADDSNMTDDFFENTLSTEYGENLANLPTEIYDRREGKVYQYITTPDGIVATGTVEDGIVSTIEFDGMMVYADDIKSNFFWITEANDVTIEGIGPDAEFFQFGMLFDRSNSIEIKNLTFSRYPEDALCFRASVSLCGPTEFGNYWIHHNTFNGGSIAWDLARSRGKGDGSTDFDNVTNYTIAYNKYKLCGKAILMGATETSCGMCVTLHHNYFYDCVQRVPYAMNGNVHSYNNFYTGDNGPVTVRGNGYYFGEANHYTNKKSIQILENAGGAAIKSYGDWLANMTPPRDVTTVSAREEYVPNSCMPDGVTDYSRFDTDPELFYYDAENNCSDVDVMLPAAEVRAFVKTYAGAGVYVRLDIPYTIPSAETETTVN